MLDHSCTRLLRATAGLADSAYDSVSGTQGPNESVTLHKVISMATNLCNLEMAIVRLAVQRTAKVCLGNKEAEERVVFVDFVCA